MGNSSVLSRSSVRSQWTYFHVGPWGKHSVADPGGEQGQPAPCIRALSGHVLLNPSWIPTTGAEDEAYLRVVHCSSAWCRHGGLEDGKVICGALQGKPREVCQLVVDATGTGFGAAMLCHGTVSSSSCNHLSATWQHAFSCSLPRLT